MAVDHHPISSYQSLLQKSDLLFNLRSQILPPPGLKADQATMKAISVGTPCLGILRLHARVAIIRTRCRQGLHVNRCTARHPPRSEAAGVANVWS